MSEVKRLEMDHKGLPFFDDNGVYVLFEDYAALQQKLDAVLAENVMLKNYLKECSVVQGEGNWISETEKSVYVPATEWLPPTPATDALLNAVRAEGAGLAGQALAKIPMREMPISGQRHHYIQRSEAILTADDIAAQLRAETDTTPSKYESLAGGK